MTSPCGISGKPKLEVSWYEAAQGGRARLLRRNIPYPTAAAQTQLQEQLPALLRSAATIGAGIQGESTHKFQSWSSHAEFYLGLGSMIAPQAHARHVHVCTHLPRWQLRRQPAMQASPATYAHLAGGRCSGLLSLTLCRPHCTAGRRRVDLCAADAPWQRLRATATASMG